MTTTNAPSANATGHYLPHYLPNLKAPSDPLFWVSALLRDQAILAEFSKEASKFWCHPNKALATAMCAAQIHFREQVLDSAREAQKAGVILFCHAETTAMTGGAA